jgi:hypothetical protein
MIVRGRLLSKALYPYKVERQLGSAHMTSNTPIALKTPPFSLAHLQVAQAQMVMSQYDFGCLVRVTTRGFTNIGDSVSAEIEFQNEHGEFEDGPKGGFYVDFLPGSHEITEVRAMVNGYQVGFMPSAALSEFEGRLDEGIDMLDDEGISLVEDWLDARSDAKGYLLGARIGHAQSLHHELSSHPMLDADKAIRQAISDRRGGVSVLITGQRADRVEASLREWRNALKAVSVITKSIVY